MIISVLSNYMIIQCNSCQKKFVVPDSAITDTGRLVQCSSCGNKWTQYPSKEKPKKVVVPKKIKKVSKVKTQRKKTSGISVYSEEYLQKKHGIKIIDPSSSSASSPKRKAGNKKESVGFGF